MVRPQIQTLDGRIIPVGPYTGHEDPNAQIQLVPERDQVWQVVDHKHTDGKGDDLAVTAFSLDDATMHLMQVVKQEHHGCQCRICECLREGYVAAEMRLKRIR